MTISLHLASCTYPLYYVTRGRELPLIARPRVKTLCVMHYAPTLCYTVIRDRELGQIDCLRVKIRCVLRVAPTPIIIISGAGLSFESSKIGRESFAIRISYLPIIIIILGPG
jgi:hypothetical protein